MSSRRSEKKHSGKVVDTKNGFDVIDCQMCRFKHVHPLPSDTELDSLYSEDYYSKEKPLYIEQYTEDLEWWKLTYSIRLRMIEQYLDSDRRTLLEIGSGPGYFLQEALGRGWSAKGIEPSVQAYAFSTKLGMDVCNSAFDESNYRDYLGYDAVYMCNVLEHLSDPLKTLGLAHEVLNDDGLILVVVPNDYNPIQKALRENEGFSPWWVAPPHHLNYFDFESLEQALKTSGFELLEKTCSFPIDMFLMMGDNYIGNDSLGRQVHARRKKFELSMNKAGLGSVIDHIYQELSDFGIGREIVMLARKAS